MLVIACLRTVSSSSNTSACFNVSATTVASDGAYPFAAAEMIVLKSACVITSLEVLRIFGTDAPAPDAAITVSVVLNALCFNVSSPLRFSDCATSDSPGSFSGSSVPSCSGSNPASSITAPITAATASSCSGLSVANTASTSKSFDSSSAGVVVLLLFCDTLSSPSACVIVSSSNKSSDNRTRLPV